MEEKESEFMTRRIVTARVVRVGSSTEEFKMEFKVRDVTPRLAKEWLGQLGKNRKLTKNLVAKFVKQLKRGEWHLTHQGVAFDEKGELIDGQHRLQAIVESGITARMVVATGVRPAAKMVLDTGRSRNFADALTISGDEPVGHREVAAIRRFIRGAASRPGGSRNQETVYQIKAVLERYRKELKFITDRLYPSTAYAARDPIRHSAVTAACMRALVQTKEREKIGQFCEVLNRGVTTGPEQQPIIMLRDFLFTAGNNGTLKHAVEVYSKTERALKSFLEGAQLGLLRATKGDLFPPPKDLPDLLKEELPPVEVEAEAAEAAN